CPPRPRDARGPYCGRARRRRHERGKPPPRRLRHGSFRERWSRVSRLAVGAVAAAATSPGRRARVSLVRDYGIVIAFVALFVTLSIASNVFLTKDNLINLAFPAS